LPPCALAPSRTHDPHALPRPTPQRPLTQWSSITSKPTHRPSSSLPSSTHFIHPTSPPKTPMRSTTPIQHRSRISFLTALYQVSSKTRSFAHGADAISVVPSQGHTHMDFDLSHAYQPGLQHLDTTTLLHHQHPIQTPPIDDHSSFDHGLSHLVDGSDDNRVIGAALSRSSSASSSIAPSPASSRASLHMGSSLRYNPIASPAGSSRSASSLRRRSIDEGAYSDDADGFDPGNANINDVMSGNRKENTRRQRIEAEQRRRDDLRDGYAKLRDVLPSKNLKGAKVAVLDRATSYIQQLESENATMGQRLSALQDECQRLRGLNEMISMGLSGRIVHNSATVPGAAHGHALPPPSSGQVPGQLHNLHRQGHGLQARGVDPADIMPGPRGVQSRRDEAFSPPTPSSSSEFST